MSLKYLQRSLFTDIETIPVALQNNYYPSLDGLRGIAITMVVLSHLNLSSQYLFNIIFNGKLGVLIFFVLSGFLITTLCLKEKTTTKNISLKNFYIRRALRILPVAYLFIISIVILNFCFNLGISYINILGAVFFLMNISSIFRQYYFSWYTGHYWSLSVEEQFYLIVPFILKKNFKIFLVTLLSIVFVLPLFICLQSVYPALNGGILYALTHYLVKFQAIAVGCLFSVAAFKYPVIEKTGGKFKLAVNVAAIILVFVIQYDDLFSLSSMFSALAISALIGYIIITNITVQKDLIFKFLNLRILKTIGVLSYSIYIWQQIFTSQDKRLPHFMVTYPYNLVCIIVVSCLSYYFYERFFLKLKSKFTSKSINVNLPVAHMANSI